MPDQPIAGREIRLVLGVIAIFLCAWASVAFTRQTGTVAAVWPADAVALTLLLKWARTPVDRVCIVACAIALEGLANVVYGSSPVFAFALAACNGLGLAVSAFLLRSLKGPFAAPRDFVIFFLGGVLIGPLAGAIPAAFVFKAFQPQVDALAILPRWFMAVGLGVGIVTPFLLALRRPRALARPDLRKVGAFVGSQLLYAAFAALVLMQPKLPALISLFPFFVLTILASRNFGAACALVSTTALAVAATAMGRGPAVVAAYVGIDPIQVLQSLLAALVLTGHPLTAMLKKLDAYAARADAARREAEELNAIKTRLLAHVSHEIRSPLSGVTSLAELMHDGLMGELSDRQRETLAQMARSGAEVEALARDLLDAATLQSGQASVHLCDVDVEDALAGAVEAARFRAREYHGSVVVVGGYAGELKVAADRLRLRQILVNLIVNGLKYGGRPPLVQVAARLTGQGMVRIEVSDNGAGLTQTQRDALFRSFQRLGAEKTDIEGAGLGLALSRELAMLQHGRLSVEDGDLGGACFVLELPVWREPAVAAAA